MTAINPLKWDHVVIYVPSTVAYYYIYYTPPCREVTRIRPFGKERLLLRLLLRANATPPKIPTTNTQRRGAEDGLMGNQEVNKNNHNRQRTLKN